MSKRAHSVAFDLNAAVVDNAESRPHSKIEGKKHSLDSDEEDSGAEEEKKDVLQVDDIEGEEDGVGGLEGEVNPEIKAQWIEATGWPDLFPTKYSVICSKHFPGGNYTLTKKLKRLFPSAVPSLMIKVCPDITITPFNMKEELEEGHFDTQGHYHWKKEKEIKDGWLDNIDWVKVKGRPEDKYKIHKDDDNMKGLGESSSDEDEPGEEFDLIKSYKEILESMKPKETIGRTLQRLGASSRISSAERWKRKKAGIVDEGSAKVTRLTELANLILTKTGNMDIYEETYEKISALLARNSQNNDDAGLDMYSDDFDKKEQASMKGGASTSQVEETSKETAIQWEFKWSQDDDAEICGPHSTEQMEKWASEGYFKTGVWVRKHGEDTQFYTSNRIDFELYL